MIKHQKLAEHLAEVLNELYHRRFRQTEDSIFCLNWRDMTALAGVKFLDKVLLRKLRHELTNYDLELFDTDHFFFVAQSTEIRARHVPGRILNEYHALAANPGDEEEDDNGSDEDEDSENLD